MASSRTHLWETVLAGKWCSLGDGTLQDALETAYSSGSDGYQFKARGYTYDIDFGRMKQVNLTTKRERNLRRVPDLRASLHSPPSTAGVTAAAMTSAAGGRPSKATRAGSLVLHPGSIGPCPSPLPAPGLSAPLAAPAPKTAAPKTAAPKTAAPKTAAPATIKAAKAAPAKVVAASVPVAPTPPPLPVKKPLPHQGKVKTFFKEKGYGFIVLDDDQEVFFHVSCVSELLDGSIRANDIVEVSVSKGGKLRALQVRVKRRGSIFKQMCKNKCCIDKGDRHFEDRCPLKRKRGDGDDASVSTACS